MVCIPANKRNSLRNSPKISNQRNDLLGCLARSLLNSLAIHSTCMYLSFWVSKEMFAVGGTDESMVVVVASDGVIWFPDSLASTAVAEDACGRVPFFLASQ